MTKFNRGYEDLTVWQKAIDLAEHIYRVTKTFPKEEIYGLTAQIRRCCVSISSNIAEGSARNSEKEFKQFLAIASGSCAELKTQLIIAERVGFIKKPDVSAIVLQTSEIERMLSGLVKSLNLLATRNLQLATNND
jgi:four helix bundle protein